MEKNRDILFKLNNIFFYSLVNDSVRDEIGIRMLSGLARYRGWYVWLNQSAGVYDLYTLAGAPENAASFAIKYYPAPEEPFFEDYSAEEKAFRTQLPFELGAPQQDQRENELAEHFVTGQMDIMWSDETIALNLNALEDNRADGQRGAPLAQLSHTFYSIFLRAVCLFTKTAPSIALTRAATASLGGSTGVLTTMRQFMTVLLPDAADKPAAAADICGAVGVNGAAAPGPEGLWQALYIEDSRRPEPPSAEYLDPLWWTLPAKSADILPGELYI